LFACAAVAFLLNTLVTPFSVSTFCRNRFDLRNLVEIAELLVRVGLVVLLFHGSGPRLGYVGAGLLAGAVVTGLGSLWTWRVLTPELRIRWTDVDRRTLSDLTRTGWWIMVSQLGVVLLLQVNLLIVNRLLGVEAGGQFGALLQWTVLLRGLAVTAAVVFTPTIISLYARGDHGAVIRYATRAVKLMGALTVLPIGLICGLAGPLLLLWLGPEFAGLDAVLIVLAGGLICNLPLMPLFSIPLAADAVRLPALAVAAAGLLNVGLALLLAGPLGWGLMGVAAANVLALALNSLLFVPAYAHRLLGGGGGQWFALMVRLLVLLALTLGACVIAGRVLVVDSWLLLGLTALVVAIAYAGVTYRWLLNEQERKDVVALCRAVTGIVARKRA
jgi:membrane protein EpsK